MNIFAEIATERREEKKQYVTALIISGKSLNEADEETERFMVEKYGEYWRSGMPPNYEPLTPCKINEPRKSFIQRIKGFFQNNE